MKKNKLMLVFLYTLISVSSYCQEDTKANNTNFEQSFRQNIFRDDFVQNDTIKVFLDDTIYYVSNHYDKYFDLIIQYSNYLNSNYVPSFILIDNLPDGYYCIYNIKKNQTQLIENINEYIVTSGMLKDGKRQGRFYFQHITDNPNSPTRNCVIYFKDNVVHGSVIEIENDRVMYLGEYKMGVKHGFFYYYNRGEPTIVLFENGKEVNFSVFK